MIHFRSMALGMLLSLMAGCGGDSGGVGVGGTGTSLTQISTNSAPISAPALVNVPVTVTGPITGFGSVIVSGLKFDDSLAAVLRDTMAIANSNLRLGMTVEIQGAKSADGLAAVATQIRVFSEIKGPVQLSATSADMFTIFGVSIRTDASTVVEGAPGVAAIKAGDLVEAYGLRNAATGEVIATRLEVTPGNASSAPVVVTINGTVQNLNAAAKTLQLGSQTVQYSAASVTGALANGTVVQVKGTTSPSGGDVLATTIQVQTSVGAGEGQAVEIEGIVNEFLSTASFKINSQSIDAGGSGLDPLEVAKVKNGARCEVAGKVMQAVLKVTQIECKAATAAATVYEVSGSISSFVSTASFVARNQTIDASAAVFSGGKPGDLAVGKRVHVKGPVLNNVLKATTLEFE